MENPIQLSGFIVPLCLLGLIIIAAILFNRAK